VNGTNETKRVTDVAMNPDDGDVVLMRGGRITYMVMKGRHTVDAEGFMAVDVVRTLTLRDGTGDAQSWHHVPLPVWHDMVLHGASMCLRGTPCAP
jgi:hypothetical protein